MTHLVFAAIQVFSKLLRQRLYAKCRENMLQLTI